MRLNCHARDISFITSLLRSLVLVYIYLWFNMYIVIRVIKFIELSRAWQFNSSLEVEKRSQSVTRVTFSLVTHYFATRYIKCHALLFLNILRRSNKINMFWIKIRIASNPNLDWRQLLLQLSPIKKLKNVGLYKTVEYISIFDIIIINKNGGCI